MPNISTPRNAPKCCSFPRTPRAPSATSSTQPDRDDLAKGDPQALQGLTIGCNPGVMQTFVGQQWLANEGITCTYKEIDTGGALFDAPLANNEVDAIIMNDTTALPKRLPHVATLVRATTILAVPKAAPT